MTTQPRYSCGHNTHVVTDYWGMSTGTSSADTAAVLSISHFDTMAENQWGGLGMVTERHALDGTRFEYSDHGGITGAQDAAAVAACEAGVLIEWISRFDKEGA